MEVSVSRPVAIEGANVINKHAPEPQSVAQRGSMYSGMIYIKTV